jgi:hypothetical protein
MKNKSIVKPADLVRFRAEPAPLAAWEAALPASARLIFYDDPSVVRIVSPSFSVPGGWRTTSFSALDHMPMGHLEHRSRFDALKEAIDRTAIRLAFFPFEVEPLLRRPSFPARIIID